MALNIPPNFLSERPLNYVELQSAQMALRSPDPELKALIGKIDHLKIPRYFLSSLACYATIVVAWNFMVGNADQNYKIPISSIIALKALDTANERYFKEATKRVNYLRRVQLDSSLD